MINEEIKQQVARLVEQDKAIELRNLFSELPNPGLYANSCYADGQLFLDKACHEPAGTETASVLLEFGADPNRPSICTGGLRLTPLHTACFYGKIDHVKELVHARASVHTKDAEERMPLHWASLLFNPEVVKFLVSRGASPEQRDKYHKTPRQTLETKLQYDDDKDEILEIYDQAVAGGLQLRYRLAERECRWMRRLDSRISSSVVRAH